MGISAIADWVPDQIYNLPGDEVVQLVLIAYGETKDGAIINHSLYAAKTRTFGNDYQVNMVVPSLMNWRQNTQLSLERVQISNGRNLTTNEKITQWSAPYFNGSNIQGTGAAMSCKMVSTWKQVAS